MAHFRLYFLDVAMRIQEAVDLECSDEAHAIREGETYDDPRAKELWQGGRLVKSFPPPGSNDTTP